MTQETLKITALPVWKPTDLADHIRVWAPDPASPIVEIYSAERSVLRLYTDGRVEGEVEDASEAGRVFVETIRHMLAESPL